ncbi:MAG: ABC transporter ATP-binding protein [SAR202 cluster bacterium]|nr:ABC transporter ATP-binding protein [SAR202 cluster bacterium]
MPGEVLISVDNISKKFCRDLKRSLWYGVKDLAFEVTLSSGRSRKLRKGEFWALKEASLEVRRGEVLGIIGHNGAGKTTMLRAINGLIKPDAGKITVRGSVGALIQLGAGFHPVLSGRENIYISGMVRGMSRKEVQRKFDEIVDFSGVKEFLDSPVRTYSSGMLARLGFSVVAHLEPDILLIDEVLSVGDAEFKAKSMERIWKLVDSGKVAVVFISHDIVSVDGLCNRVVLMDHGEPHEGEKSVLIARYYGDDLSGRARMIFDDAARERLLFEARTNRDKLTGDVEITSMDVVDTLGLPKEVFRDSDTLVLRVRYRAKRPLTNFVGFVFLDDPIGIRIFAEKYVPPLGSGFKLQGDGELHIQFDPIQLKSGRYHIGFSFQDPTMRVTYGIKKGAILTVNDGMVNPQGKSGFVKPNVKWHLGTLSGAPDA